MSQRDVADLVRHDASDLALGLRRLDHPAVDEHRPARQRERVDFADVHDPERVAEARVLLIRRNSADQAPADVLHVGRHLIVPHDGQLLFNLRRRLAAELDVLLDGIAVFRRRYLRLRGDQGRQHQDKESRGVHVRLQL